MDTTQKTDRFTIPASILIATTMIVGAVLYKKTELTIPPPATSLGEHDNTTSQSVSLGVVWGNLGIKLVAAGVIDAEKMRGLYTVRGTFPETWETLLSGNTTEELVITAENAPYLLNLFWAFGLANTNPILEAEMMDSRYGGAGNFASTAGWTLAVGNAMNHYNMHPFVTLTEEQQMLVDRVARGVYRPCCGNATHFPDCNHGMAMLGLLELLASQDASEKDLWDAALVANRYWFPGTYEVIGAFLAQSGLSFGDVSPEEILGKNFSSAAGFRSVQEKVRAPVRQSGGCSV